MDPAIGAFDLVDLIVVVGVALVVPWATASRWEPWAIVAALVAAGAAIDPGPLAVALTVPWPALATALATRSLIAVTTTSSADPRTWPADQTTRIAALAWVAAAALWMLAAAAGWSPFGVGEPIVRLTAVHFTYAGAASLVLAVLARRRARPRTVAAGTAAVALTAIAPPIVAVGFLTSWALFQVGGAVLMSAGVLLTAALHLAEATRDDEAPGARGALVVSGLSPWVPMGLAVTWAAAHYVDVPALSIPDMARTHGIANAVGFVGAGALARRRWAR